MHCTRCLKIVTLILSLILVASSVESAGSKIAVKVDGSADEVSSFNSNGVTYLSLSELSNIVGGSLDWVILGHTVSYIDKGFRFDFLIGSPFFMLNDSTFNFTYPAVYRDGQLFVPAVTFVPFYDRVSAQRAIWEDKSAVLKIESDRFNVTDLSFSPKANGLLVELMLTQPLSYDAFLSEGNWINISIRDAKLNIAKLESRKDLRYLFDIKLHQDAGVGQVSLQFRRDVSNWRHKLANDPPRIQISLADAGFTIDSTDSTPPKHSDSKIDVVAIDAGHGGQDYGAIGRNGTREKDVTLAIARDLADLIRKDKLLKVVMTRNSDKTMTLQERADIANKAGADLFISIHANANPSKRVRGWNVFFLAPAKNDSARAVEQLENSYFLREVAGTTEEDTTSGPSPDNPVVGILNEMLMTEFQSESHDLAIMVDHEFHKSLEIPARGVDQAGFFVLNKVFTPSVLVETAFITNSSEEKLLKQSAFQQEVAEALYAAIKRFKAKYESH
ncbi:MAG TPA: N-acetylmuramoyl-L-alanine amidase [Candidatus Acidoferrum sp.]|nr:N-acetylmuramoyl-L-alanine amidase [Candidatus Acidoferrum sp.]